MSDLQQKYELLKAQAVTDAAEIDELKWMLRNSNAQADDFCKKSIDFKNRINKALWHLSDHDGYDDLTHVINILKGN